MGGGLFFPFFFLEGEEAAAWKDVDPGKGKCAHGRGGGGIERRRRRRTVARVFLVKARGEECCKNMAPDEGDNVMRVTKVDVPQEEKGLALDNEGLLYGCHGDERVSQASSFL